MPEYLVCYFIHSSQIPYKVYIIFSIWGWGN